MFRRFRKRFEYKNADGDRVMIPRGWSGELADEIAKSADDAGATYMDKSAKKKKDAENIDDLSKDALVAEARRRKIDVRASDAKAEILAAVQAAMLPFAKPLADMTAEERIAEAKERRILLPDGADDAATTSALEAAAAPLA